MTEQETSFTSEEAISIGEYSKEIARLGEDAIYDLLRKKNQLSMAAYHTLNSLPANDDTVIFGRQLMHDVEVMDEVLRQAKAIRQVMGVDEYANLKMELDGHKGQISER